MLEPKLYTGGVFADDRGLLSYVNELPPVVFKREYFVENHTVGTSRFWHLHRKEAKLVTVVKGTALIGIFKLDDPFAVPQKYILSENCPKQLWIPPGYANGAKSLSTGTKIKYLSTLTLEESKLDDERLPYDYFPDFLKENPR